MIKFKPLKKFLKKFKILLNLQYNKKSEDFLLIKTQVKSILSQSGILEAGMAENYIETIFYFFFIDLYLIHPYLDDENYIEKIEDKSINIKQYDDGMIRNKEFNFNLLENDFEISLLNLFKYCNFDDDNKFCERLKNKKNTNRNEVGLKKIKMYNYRKFELYRANFLLPVYIYIYRKEFKNIIFVLNLLTSALLSKFLYNI
jgi:hypothetical protein